MPTFSRALTRQPAPSAADGITTSAHLGPPDLDLMLRQHAAYCDALAACGLHVETLPPDPAYPDGHFVEDTAVIYRELLFVCRAGATARQGEEVAVTAALPHAWQVSLSGEQATLEGGDVLVCHDRVLIGLSRRTNRTGAEQLRAAIHAAYADVRVELIPVGGVLHLKTGLTELAPGVLLRAAAFHTEADLRFAEVITLPPAESHAANVLPINDALLIASRAPRVAAIAQAWGVVVQVVDISEFEKMDGGLTCLSLRWG